MKTAVEETKIEKTKRIANARKAPPWKNMVSGKLASEAINIATIIADRMLEGDVLSDAITKLPEQSDNLVYWDGYGLMAGFNGIALLYNQLDKCFPGQGWRRVANHFLKISKEIFNDQFPDLEKNLKKDDFAKADDSFCSGTAGMGFTLMQFPRNKANLDLLERINKRLEKRIRYDLDEASASEGLSTTQFDVLYGITGSGRYLLASGSSKTPAKNINELLKLLVNRSRMKDGHPALFTPYELLHELEKKNAIDAAALVNCGLAHGVPGPMGLMALALKEGYQIEGLRAAVEFWAQWLQDQVIHDEWGVNWPGSCYIDAPDSLKGVPTRAAWCYGSPGVARTMYMAGDALGDSSLKDFAAKAMLDTFKRPAKAQNNASPTFCHGRCGLLQIALRFAVDSGLPEFQQLTNDLCAELVNAFDEKTVWGYADLLPGDQKCDNPGLLTGAAGIALTLLSAATSIEPRWDQPFLIS